MTAHGAPGSGPRDPGLALEQLADLLSGAAAPAAERQALAHFLAACPTCAATAALLVEKLGLGGGEDSTARAASHEEQPACPHARSR